MAGDTWMPMFTFRRETLEWHPVSKTQRMIRAPLEYLLAILHIRMRSPLFFRTTLGLTFAQLSADYMAPKL
jgi:hypothetical protein